MRDNLPRPIAVSWANFENENDSGYTRLRRLVDAYEALIKYVAILAIQNFYAENLPSIFPEIDRRIRERLQQPSLGDWETFLKITLKCFKDNEAKLLSSDLYLFCFQRFGSDKPQSHFKSQGVSEKYLNLRNRYIGHGATLERSEAVALTQQYEPHLLSMLDQADFLTRLNLAYVEQQLASGEFKIRLLMGSKDNSDSSLVLSSPRLTTGHLNHLIVFDSSIGKVLDLHPLLHYGDCNYRLQATGHLCARQKVMVYNGLKPSSIDYLDPDDGHHSSFKSPHPLSDEFVARFPRVQTGPTNEFSALIRRHIEFFTGRQPDLAALDRFVAQTQSKVMVIYGSPGVGKTALLAKWSDEHSSVRQFIQASDASTYDTLEIFKNLARQLSQKYRISWKPLAHLDLGEYSSQFRAILSTAASRAETPIAVVIDGLDEAQSSIAETRSRHQLLSWLPSGNELPDNVRLILSGQPTVKTFLEEKYGIERVLWRYLDHLSVEEVRAYLYQFRSEYEVLLSSDYVQAIVEKSEGNPLYLSLLRADLMAGRLVFGLIGELPTGLASYYERTIRLRARQTLVSNAELRAKQELLEQLVKDGTLTEQQLAEKRLAVNQDSRWRGIDLLALYCVAREPLTRQDAANILNVDEDILNHWFESTEGLLESDEKKRFRVFHDSFRIYFTTAPEHAEAIMRARRAILEFCSAWKHHHNLYAIKYYAAHLAEASAWADLHELVATGEGHQAWAEERQNFDGSYAGYLADLDIAWQAISMQPERHIEREVRYAIIMSAVRSIAAERPLGLPSDNVKSGLWTLRTALDYIATIPSEWRRVLELERLIETVAVENLSEMINDIRKINDDVQRAETLCKIGTRLPRDSEGVLVESLATARNIHNLTARIDTFQHMFAELPIDSPIRRELIVELQKAVRQLPPVETAIRGQGYSWLEGLQILLSHLPAEQRAVVISQAILEARSILDEWTRDKAMRFLEEYPASANTQSNLLGMSDDSISENDGPNLEVIWTADETSESDSSSLRNDGPSPAAAVPSADNLISCVAALSRLLDELPEEFHQNAYKDFVLVAEKALLIIEQQPLHADEYDGVVWGPRSDALIQIIPSLPIGLLSKALDIANRMDSVVARAGAYCYLLTRMPRDLYPNEFYEVLEFARALPEKYSNAEEWSDYMYGSGLKGFLICLTKMLSEEAQNELLMIVNQLPLEGDVRPTVLLEIARYLPHYLQELALEFAWKLPLSSFYGFDRLSAFEALLPTLSDTLREKWLPIARDYLSQEMYEPYDMAANANSLGARIASELMVEEMSDHLRRLDNASHPSEAIVPASNQRLSTEWPVDLHELAGGNLRDLVKVIADGSSLRKHSGGEKTIVEAFNAICDVVRWWM